MRNQQAPREHLRELLEELFATLADVPYTTSEEAIAHLQQSRLVALVGPTHLHRLIQPMPQNAPTTDLLQWWKDSIGFPHGTIDDMLALSDPPQYTACPNPFLPAVVAHWQQENRPTSPDERPPFTTDVSEGKYDPWYKLHPYPTKMPPRAIMRYILHYTDPGDIVLDSFCGTGMTGVAASLCEDRASIESAGYHIQDDGTILNHHGQPFARLGPRRAILNDLSPSATFIAQQNTTALDGATCRAETSAIFRDLEQQYGWMYRTLHQPSATHIAHAIASLTAGQSPAPDPTATPELSWGDIHSTLWSDVFLCPHCAGDIVFWNVAVDHTSGHVSSQFACPHCQTTLTRRSLHRAWDTRFDPSLRQTVRQIRQIPVLIHYRRGGQRFEKEPDPFDTALLKHIEQTDIPDWFPTDRMPPGDESRRNDDLGLTHVHHFYTRRNLCMLAGFAQRAPPSARFAITRVASQITRMYRLTYQNGVWGAGGGPLSGTLYVPSLVKELAILKQLRKAIANHIHVRQGGSSEPASENHGNHCITTGNAAQLSMLPDECIDYIFIDPPFADNLMYSELNFFWEAWLRVLTNNTAEVVENRTQGKNLHTYRDMMTDCFRELHRLLKPERWMTVAFHNARKGVWQALQQTLQHAGFIVADVRVLNKQKETFKQVTASGTVQQDLIISAYKPRHHQAQPATALQPGHEEAVWEFVRERLAKLPLPAWQDNTLQPIDERTRHLLFDRMVAFHVQHSIAVPLSAAEFYTGLEQRYPRHQDMYFLPEQAESLFSF